MIEQTSETWQHIAAKIDEQIEQIRDQLEMDKNDEKRTTWLRARIRAFRDVLDWANAAPDQPIEGNPITWQL